MSDDFWAKYEARKKTLAEDTALNRTAVMAKLKELGVGMVKVLYDGSGDSGQIEEVRYYTYVDGQEEPQLMGSPHPIKDALISWKDSHTNRWPMPEAPTISEASLADAVENLCYDYLEVEHPGWENNDGADGEFTFNVFTNEIHWQHRSRFTDYELTEHEI
jgi:hypothetical protein